MSKLFSLIYGVAATALAGICIIIALVAKYDRASYIIIAALIGAALAIPVAQAVAKRIER